jgi:hypothetical protein
MALQSFVGPWPIFQFLNPIHSARTPWTVISPWQGIYLHTEQHKHKINAHNTNIHVLRKVRTHDPSVRANKAVYALDRAAPAIYTRHYTSISIIR